jgi:hypothetical protein
LQVLLPNEIIKGLYILFDLTAAFGVTITAAQLGNVRVNYRGTDIVNAPASFFLLENNLHMGLPLFDMNAAAESWAAIYIPFHMPWDEQNGLINTEEDRGMVSLNFPGLIGAVAASGLVSVYTIPAKTIATYVPLWMQQNIQVGGAGTVTERLRNFNISSLYIVPNVHITGTVLVNKDGLNVINANQIVLQGYSDTINEVEAATCPLFQVDLNPNHIIGNAISNTVEVNLGMDAATTVELYILSVLYQQQASQAVSSAQQAYTPATIGNLSTAPLVRVTGKPAPVATA